MKQWKHLLVVHILVLLLGNSWQVAHAEMASLSRQTLATIVSAGLLVGLVALPTTADQLSAVQQQERRQHLYQQNDMSGSPSVRFYGWHEQLNSEEDNALAWSEELTQQGGAVFYLALRSPDYEHLHHVVYVGDTVTGEAMLAGMFLDGHQEDYLKLYAHDGLVAQGFTQRDVKVFPDPLDLYAQVTVFTVKDLSLRGRYMPAVPELFPVVEIGEQLQMVQYGVREDDPETFFDLPIRQRSCKVLDPKVWAKLGIGRHTCTALEDAHSSFGAPIFRAVNGKLVGFHGGSTPAKANHAEGMTDEFVNFVIEQQTNPTAIDHKGKLAVTWGSLKVAK